MKCPAALGRGLHLVSWSDLRAPAWRLLVVTRCRGWRRHRYTAVVSEAPGALHFGPLRPS